MFDKIEAATEIYKGLKKSAIKVMLYDYDCGTICAEVESAGKIIIKDDLLLVFGFGLDGDIETSDVDEVIEFVITYCRYFF